jgi:restriction endonuclease S subunit
MKCSEISFKKILADNTLLRFDAEYYSPEYVEAEKLVRSKPHQELRNLISILTDYHANGSYETLRNNVQLLDYPDYALMIRTVDFERDDFEHDVKYISEHAYNFLKKTQILGKEIVINKIGNAGKVYVVPPLKRKVSLGMNQFMIRPNRDVIDGYLYVYLSCKYGSKLLEQKITGAVPLSIDKESLRSVFVPTLDHGFQVRIDNILNNHFDFRSKSKELYSQAEQILLSELGLQNWKPKYKPSFIRNYSDTQSVDRIDAEYFQPVYDEILTTVKSAKGYAPLGDLVSIKKCVEPGSEAYKDSGVPFVRVSNLSKFGINDDNQQFISESLYESLEMHQPKKGEILLSKDATPGIAYYLSDVPRKMIPSSGILRLTVKDSVKIHPEYLALVLNSLIVQKQIERDVGGSVINHWLVDQVNNTIIPLLDDVVQKEMSGKIAESFLKRNQSKSLLKIAKIGVEMAIEKSEAEALKWINQEVKSYA